MQTLFTNVLKSEAIQDVHLDAVYKQLPQVISQTEHITEPVIKSPES
jgi:hypothetical protein